MPCPRAPTSRNPFVCRFNVACTPAQPQSCLASHNFQQERTRSSSATQATSTAHLLCNARRTCTSHTTTSAAMGAQRIRPAASFLPALLPTCCHCLASPAMPQPTTLFPAVPAARPPFAPGTGRLASPVPVRPARPPSPAIVYVQCADPVLVGVLLRLRSGRSWLISGCFVFDRGILPCLDEPPAPSLRRRVQRRPVVPASTSLAQPRLRLPGALCCSAQQWLPFSLAVSVALACLPAIVHSLLSHRITSCTRHAPHTNHTHRLHLHATHTTRRAPHTHCTYHSLTIPGVTPPTSRTFQTHHTHTTPHPLITHIHPQTPHTTRHSFLRICKSEMYALCSMPGMHSSAQSSSTNISNAIHPSKVKLSYTKSYPHKYNYKDTHKDAHKYATTDTPSAIRTNTQITVHTPQIRPQKNAHKYTYS
jgi:hypothetical protein